MKYRAARQSHTFTLANVLVALALVAVLLAVGRAIGYIALLAFLASPWPVVGYIRFVRGMLGRMEVDFESRSVFQNLVFWAGLLFAGAVTLVLLGAGLTNLRLH